MFKKHEFTCPDVVYLRNRAARNNKIALLSYLGVFGGMIAWGTYLDRKDKKNDELTAVMDAVQE